MSSDRNRKGFTWLLINSLIFLLLTASPSLAVNYSEGKGIPSGNNICDVIINKCSQDIVKNLISIPDNLRAPLSPNKVRVLNSSCYHHNDNDTGTGTGTNSGLFNWNFQLNKPKCLLRDRDLQNSNSENTTEHLNNKYVLSLQNENSEYLYEDYGLMEWVHNGYMAKPYYFTPEGYLKIDRIFISPHNYCVSNITKDEITVEACAPPPSPRTSSNEIETNAQVDEMASVVIWKCCPMGTVIQLNLSDPRTMDCVETNEEWTPYFYREESTNDSQSSSSVPRFEKINENSKIHQIPRPYYEHKILECENGTDFEIKTSVASCRGPEKSEIRVTDLGKVYTRPSGNHKWDVPKQDDETLEHFCIDGLLEMNTATEFRRSERNQILVYCPIPHSQAHAKTLSKIYFSMMIISSVFLCAVVVTYALVWDKQNIHGWTIVAYSFSTFGFLICQSWHHGIGLFQGRGALIQIDTPPCFGIGVALHFFYIATFSWMTVLSFDLWSTIVSMVSTKGRQEEKKRFLSYFAFGFGVPTIVVSVSIFLELYFGHFNDQVVRPQYGRIRCDLDHSAYLYHAVIVNTLLFGLNILLGALTVQFLLNYRTQAKRLQQRTSTSSNRRNNVESLFAKLFVLLGFTWIFELGGWYFTNESTWYIAIFDMYNLLQSVALFWIFVCKKDMKKHLRTKYGSFERMFSWWEDKGKTTMELSEGTYAKKMTSSVM